MLCFPSPFPRKGWVPCVFVLCSHALIPTGAHFNYTAALPKPIIISVPKPHCCKGSASKPYVEFPPHTAPLGMGVGPAQACAVQVVVRAMRKSAHPNSWEHSFLELEIVRGFDPIPDEVLSYSIDFREVQWISVVNITKLWTTKIQWA
jgi:hypothetical protein